MEFFPRFFFFYFLLIFRSSGRVGTTERFRHFSDTFTQRFQSKAPFFSWCWWWMTWRFIYCVWMSEWKMRKYILFSGLLCFWFCHPDHRMFSKIEFILTHYSKSQIFVQKFNFDKTPTFSRVFHPNFFWQFFSWNQSCQQLKSPKPQHFHEFFTLKIVFFGKSKLNFRIKNEDFEQCVFCFVKEIEKKNLKSVAGISKGKQFEFSR